VCVRIVGVLVLFCILEVFLVFCEFFGFCVFWQYFEWFSGEIEVFGVGIIRFLVGFCVV